MKSRQIVSGRINELYILIVTNEKPKARIRKVITYPYKDKPQYCYVVTLSKNEKPFAERIKSINKLFTENLKPNERLVYNNDCFCIVSDEYEISYMIEGYNKQANKTGCIRNGAAYEKLLCRMGFEFAIRYARQYHVYELATAKMGNPGWQEKYPNPADRFAALVKHERGK